jgi:hypothetical protein
VHGFARMSAIDPPCFLGRKRGVDAGRHEGTTVNGERLRLQGSKSCRYRL